MVSECSYLTTVVQSLHFTCIRMDYFPLDCKRPFLSDSYSDNGIQLLNYKAGTF